MQREKEVSLLTVDCQGESLVTLPSHIKYSITHGLDAPLSQSVHTPDQKLIQSGFRSTLQDVRTAITNVFLTC